MLYDTLINMCNKKGTSLSRVCIEIGLNKSSATAWKRGGGISPATLYKLADYFGVSVDQILRDSGTTEVTGPNGALYEITFPSEDAKKDPAQSAESNDLSAALSDLTDEELRDVLDYIKFKKSQRG